jgi:hypothetical protein
LVFHYWGNGPITEHGFPPERIGEINLRYADVMFERIRQLNPAPVTEERKPTERVVGCCRDSTLFFVSMARHHGIPARIRVGFASYLMPGWYLDHVVAEVWDNDRWRLVEPQFGDGFQDPVDGTVLDQLDVPREKFLVAPQAWAECRSGRLDPAKFVVSPDLDVPFLREWPYLLHNLVLDLAALNKHEMILWDTWGVMHDDEPPMSRMDELAARMLAGDVHRDFEDGTLRVPPVVTSVNPPDQTSRQVVLR